MQTSNTHTTAFPKLPSPISMASRLLPAAIHNRVLAAALNRIFDLELKAGELDFLNNRVIKITLDDAGIEYRLTLACDEFRPADNRNPDLQLQGTVYHYLLLASRREDTDTLFFSRCLRMQGDTELGLYVKNFLDGIDIKPNSIPARLENVLQKGLPVYERLFG